MSEVLHHTQGADVYGGAIWISTDDAQKGVYRVDMQHRAGHAGREVGAPGRRGRGHRRDRAAVGVPARAVRRARRSSCRRCGSSTFEPDRLAVAHTGLPPTHHALAGTPAHGLGIVGRFFGSGCMTTPVGLRILRAGRAGPEAGVAEHLGEERAAGVRRGRERPARGLELLEVGRRAAVGRGVAGVAVLRLVRGERDLPEVDVARVPEEPVVRERVVQERVAFGVVDAAEARGLHAAGAGARLAGIGRAAVGIGHEEDAPRAVVRRTCCPSPCRCGRRRSSCRCRPGPRPRCPRPARSGCCCRARCCA